MRQDKMSVRLIASREMDEQGDEDGAIRIPKRARSQFQIIGPILELKVNGKSKALSVKKANKEDISKLLAELNKKKISTEEAERTAFVTTKTLKYFAAKTKQLDDACYITESVSDLMVGADPEFALVDPETKDFFYANQTGLGLADELGADGPLAEIRPAPSTDTEQFIETIHQLFKRNAKAKGIDKYQWIGGATFKGKKRTLAIGGHIHIGNPAILPEEKKTAVYSRIIQILDEMVAMPLVRIDGPDAATRRRGPQPYGKYGDQRNQVGRFEWRVLSGLWLLHPELARAIVGASKAVSEESYQMIANNGFDDKYVAAPGNQKGFLKDWRAMASADVATIVNSSDTTRVSPEMISKLREKFKSMSNYDKYKTEIDTFFDLVKMSEKDRGNLSLDVRENWLGSGKMFNS